VKHSHGALQGSRGLDSHVLSQLAGTKVHYHYSISAAGSHQLHGMDPVGPF